MAAAALTAAFGSPGRAAAPASPGLAGSGTDALPAASVSEEQAWIPVEGDTSALNTQMGRRLAPLVAREDFAELDKLANELRASRIQASNGTWHLRAFYEELVQAVADGSEKQSARRLQLLRAWVRAQPKSITARVAFGRGLVACAWRARGGGGADTVAPEAQRRFEQRLEEAARALQEARALEARCPVWWDCMQLVALGQGWSLTNYNRLFNEAIAFEPDYVFYYHNKVVFLLPRWYGREGDWQRFAAEAASARGGAAGDILYARVGWRVHERRFYGAFQQDAGYGWSRMQRGLQAIVKQYPDSLSAASELAYLSYQAGDIAVAKPMFERIGRNVDQDIWGKDTGKFLRGRTWALKAY
jgi:hypothetical protein